MCKASRRPSSARSSSKPSSEPARTDSNPGVGRSNGRRLVPRFHGKPDQIETAMTIIRTAFILALGLAVATAAGYGYSHRSTTSAALPSIASQASAAERAILYYRDPSGAPSWSATPKNDMQGRAYLPVYDDAEPGFDPPRAPPPPLALLKSEPSGRKVLYYRNPMGLPDTSPVPKKDSMGMDYIAVYEGDEPNDGKTIKVSLDRIQRSGVRTEPVEARALVRAPVSYT